jgi:uncharacterized caspase-like protein
MRIAHVVALSVVVFASGSALAQEALSTIEVKAEESERTMTISCVDPVEPSLKEVETVLNIADPAQANPLRKELMAAAAEACAKQVPKISVARTAKGNISWRPLQ